MRRFGMLALVLAAAGCSDGPTSPATRATAVEAAAGSGQSAAPGAAVAVAPAVRVRGGSGQPLQGVGVEFTVTGGGGSVAVTRARTGADGIASAGAWTLGAEPGVNTVEAVAGSAAPVVFSATATVAAEPGEPTPTPGAYDIQVRWIGTATARQRAAVDAAMARWRSVIVADLPNVPLTARAGECFEGQPALSEVIDDLLIYIQFVDIDGPRQVLGEAGPCYVRAESSLPLLGYLKLDAADLELMETAGTLDDVVLHEIGHILGIGTLWGHVGLLEGAGGEDPTFTGGNALAAYRALGGVAIGVPVENTGGEGTRDGHWRETDFGNELMTPFISGIPNPLSALTVASLTDLGYGATTGGASAYALGGLWQAAREPIDLRGREQVKGPMFKVDRNGRKERLDELPAGARAHGLRN